MKYLLAAGAGVVLYMWWKQGTVVQSPLPQNPLQVRLPGGSVLTYQPQPQVPAGSAWNSMFPPSTTGPQAQPGMINGYY